MVNVVATVKVNTKPAEAFIVIFADDQKAAASAAIDRWAGREDLPAFTSYDASVLKQRLRQ